MAPVNPVTLTMEAIRASGQPHPSARAATAILPKHDPTSPAEGVAKRRAEAAANFTTMKAVQDTTRPPTIKEVQRVARLATGHVTRMIVVQRKTAAAKAPIVVLFHTSGWTMGSPEYELNFAREGAEATGAIFVLPTYRFAPENPFPAAIDDAWELVRLVAREALMEPAQRKILPVNADASVGFVVGGTCSGANLASVVAHLARDTALEPPLTGQLLAEGWFMFPAKQVPAPYSKRWISYRENTLDPFLPPDIIEGLEELLRPPKNGERISTFAWPNWDDGVDDEGRVGKGHIDLPPTYFQASGMDPLRDDTLVFETVLREESGVPTRLDLYPGFPHCSLGFVLQVPEAKKWMDDRVEGLKWLLEHSE